ncbi:LytTR family transcriptional regulator DNA-binding domain-containing protein [Actinoplanes sp. NBC_00393]|uniref:LytTR family DNA-binding domain-containing protein n=1 Tax=Actinoplanes sp. NBC_00393 TaxID=2975953 RepID=UPI002E1AC512
MVELVCSPGLRARLERELAAHDVELGADTRWVLVERGFEVPAGRPAIVFDALDYMDVVRLLVAGVREQNGGARSVVGQRGSNFVVLTAREVVYLEAVAEGIVARTASGRDRVRGTLQHFEVSWAGLGFVRINRSQLVNLAHVREIVPWFNSRYVLRLAGGEEVEVSKTYAKRLRSALRM